MFQTVSHLLPHMCRGTCIYASCATFLGFVFGVEDSAAAEEGHGKYSNKVYESVKD